MISLLMLTAASADDTDIYKPPKDADFQPSLMFMVDSSHSMRFTGEAWMRWRFDRLKEPLIDFLRSAGDLNVGLSSFNGANQGGAVLYPADDLDRDLCPDASCGSITLRAPVLHEGDDAYERLDNNHVSTTSAANSLGQRIDPLGSGGWYLDKFDQSVVQTASGEMMSAEVLPLFEQEDGQAVKVGLHFPSIPVASNVTLSAVYLTFDWSGNEWLDPENGEGAGIAKARIYMDSRKNSPPFADAAGQRVDDRPKAAGHVNWTVRRPLDWATSTDKASLIRTPNLLPLFSQVLDSGETGPVSFMISAKPGSSVDRFNTVNLRGVHTRGTQYPPPRLVILFTRNDIVPEGRIVGTRFDKLDIPPKAKILKAHMEVDVWHKRDVGLSSLRIRAEATPDAAPFYPAKRNLSNRPMFATTVPWYPPLWYDSTGRQRTPDITSVIQEVVNQDDWCGGNALSLHVTGTGERYSYNYKAGALRAASLHVTYDPASVNDADNCRSEAGNNILLLRSENDVIETGAALVFGEPVFAPAKLNHPRMGMRFKSVDLDPGDVIAAAQLTLTNAGLLGGPVYFEVAADVDTFDQPFVAGAGVRAHTSAGPKAYWRSEDVVAGDLFQSVELASLIQKVIDSPQWSRGSDIVLSVRRIYGAGSLSIKTSAGASGDGPRLQITRQIKGVLASSRPLRTPRDELIEAIQQLPATGRTPLIDAYFETAQYLLGGPVVHGKKRGEQKADNHVHRLSSPTSYDGGVVERPAGCSADNLDLVACVTETIENNPTYIAPASSECRPNQIVLVTDGNPSRSPSDTPTRIQTLLGSVSCEAAPKAQRCGADLAEWLANGGTDRHPIVTNTVGFDFESSFLTRLAEKGGGTTHTVASSGQLSEALRQLGDTTKYRPANLVAPAATVSQFNRFTHRDDLYFAMFSPAPGKSVWPGNIKRYTLGKFPGTEQIGVIDANGQPALDAANGTINTGARSHWSPDRDGANVDKGGAARRLPLVRNVLTYLATPANESSAGNTLDVFDVDNKKIDATSLGVLETERDNAISWMQGIDVKDEDLDGIINEPRRKMGAAMHTTPSALNYPSTAAQGRSVVFAGTNEGFLHAVDSMTGDELFAFLPKELFTNVGTFYSDSASDMLYGLDGPVTAWVNDKNGNGVVDASNGEKAYVTVGMRRGGKHYYTLDVTDPDNPTFAWRVHPERIGFEKLAQTWSKPIHARMYSDGGAASALTDVLIFGNGYDVQNDAELRYNDGTGSDPGAVYIVDAATGEPVLTIEHSDMAWSVPSDISAVDLGMDGVVDTLLFGDVGGNLWRVDLATMRDKQGGATGTSAAAISMVAKLSNHNLAVTGDRRFFHAPDVALMRQEKGQLYLGVTIGSGRRDRPLLTGVQNRLYALRLPVDASDAGTSPTLHESDLIDATSAVASMSASSDGWYIDLEHVGEKIFGAPVVVNGRIMFTSYIPPSTSGSPCEPDLGGGRIYVLDAFNAKSVLTNGDGDDERSRELAIDGIPAPVSVLVSRHDPDTPVALVGLETVDGIETMPAKRRTYWVDE